MKKVKLNVVVEKKVDNRVNNTGRPVNKKSARQIRLAKQALYSKLNKQFIQGKKFKINNEGESYVYHVNTDSKRKGAYGHISSGKKFKINNSDSIYAYSINDKGSMGCITNSVGMYVCNVSYIGRTKIQGFTYVLDKRVNVEINLKNVKFV